MLTLSSLNVILFLLLCWLKTASSAPVTVSLPTASTPVDLDLGITQSNDYEYRKDVNMLTFTPNNGKTFKLVKESGVTIWEGRDASNYSHKVEVDLITAENKAVTVHLSNNKTNVFRKHGKGKPWTEIDTNKTNPQSVNIKYKYNSYFYTNTETDGGRRFEAKNGFAFNVVNEYVNNNRVEIWKTDQVSDYANKVEVERDKLTIYVGEGSNAKSFVFNKGSDGKWTQDSTTRDLDNHFAELQPLSFPEFTFPEPVAPQVVPTAQPTPLVIPPAKPAAKVLNFSIPKTTAAPVAETIPKPSSKTMNISIPLAGTQAVPKPVSQPVPVPKAPEEEQPPKSTSQGLNPFNLKLVSVPLWSDGLGADDEDSESPGTKLIVIKDQVWKSAVSNDTSKFKSLIEELSSQQSSKVASVA